jgi:predicted transposase/invertase (TIGR01784 family)
LISLINSIVSEEDQVAEITLLNPYNPRKFKKDKLSILDIKAKGVSGKRFNIEMQVSRNRKIIEIKNDTFLIWRDFSVSRKLRLL